MRARVDRALIALLAALSVASAAAQDDGVPRAPRLQPRPGAPAAAPPEAAPPAAGGAAALDGPLRPPSATRLAPLPEERNTAPDEIIVIGQGWRLPDLGSRWREKQLEAAGSGRFHATALPLYDPAEPPLRNEGFSQNPEAKRHGYIELFRLRFGGRREKTDPAD
jgi:hypothetical protein